MTGARWGAMGWLRSGQGGCGEAPDTPLGLVTVRKRLKESVSFISWPSMMHLKEIEFVVWESGRGNGDVLCPVTTTAVPPLKHVIHTGRSLPLL